MSNARARVKAATGVCNSLLLILHFEWNFSSFNCLVERYDDISQNGHRLVYRPFTFMTRLCRIPAIRSERELWINWQQINSRGKRAGERKWMKARAPWSLLRLRTSFVVIPTASTACRRCPAFPIFPRRDGDHSRKERVRIDRKREREGGKEREEGSTLPSKFPKGIIIISWELGLLKRKQTPL